VNSGLKNEKAKMENSDNKQTKARRPKTGEKLTLKIEGLAFGGSGVARADDGIVAFVRGGVPGDVVEATVTRRKRGYIETRADSLVSASPDRVEPRCAHFGGPTGGLCGGCVWQNYPYHLQLDWKRRQVSDCLERIARVPTPPVEPIIGMENPWEYRNKMEYTFGEGAGGSLSLGMHRAGFFDRVVNVDRCHLQAPRLCELRNMTRAFASARGLTHHWARRHEGLMRNLVVRASSKGDVMACVVTHTDEFDKYSREYADAVAADFPEVKSLLWRINPSLSGVAVSGEERVLGGEDHIIDEVCGLKLKISAASFAQTNHAQSEKLYQLLIDNLEISGGETAYDIYSGMAPIAMLLAGRAGRVIGIESNPDAVADGRDNIQLNGFSNVEMVEGEAEKVIAEQCAEAPPDIVSVDPPRVGMHPKVLKAVAEARPRQVLYISCNPSTLARDAVELIEAGYSLERVIPVDMFPHTAHIEAFARFDLRS